MSTELRNFLSLSYDELEQLNLKAKEQRKKPRRAPQSSGRATQVSHRREAHQAVTVLFSDLEGRLHMLDYDNEVSRKELGQFDV